jgi:asparagine synthetase B (glutamine-hydrolysing)
MCGIFCCYNRQGDLASFRPRAVALSKLQRHRGPDWSGCYMSKDTVLVHERLAIVGVGELCPRLSQLGYAQLTISRYRSSTPSQRG